MNWRNPTTGAGYGLDTSSWSAVLASATTLMGTCLDGRARSGGELYIASRTLFLLFPPFLLGLLFRDIIDLANGFFFLAYSINPVLVIWIWASGADQWEKRLNAYMNDVGENPMMPAAAYGADADGVGNYTVGVGNGTLVGAGGGSEGEEVQTT